MDGLRKAPRQMSELKRVYLNTEEEEKRTDVYGRHYMTADWGYSVAEPATWKLYFDTFGGEALPERTKKSA
ncbi:hypothetical protein N7G274_010138 [Stereocaulon virgatum]|uniref:Uncharacterized protein n=1 Tax=Stereocaulon virgatum TaxID=373712 RepID=A0ABR3ZYI7_9LECA